MFRKSWISSVAWVALAYNLVGRVYQMVDFWANFEFVTNKAVVHSIADGFIFHPIALNVLFVAAFLWLAWQTDFIRNIIHRSSLRFAPHSGPRSGYTIVMEPRGAPRMTHVYAQLEIKNKGAFLRNCKITAVGISDINSDGQVLPLVFPPRDLCWNPDHPNPNQRSSRRDIANDGVPVLADVAHLNQSQPEKWSLVTADSALRESFPPGWYKLDLILSSESEQPNTKLVELVVGLGVRENPPPPIVLRLWKDWEKQSGPVARLYSRFRTWRSGFGENPSLT